MHGHGDVDAIITRIRQAWGPGLLAAVIDRSFADPLPRDVRSAFLHYAERVDPRAAEEVLTSQRDLDLIDRLPELALPVAVVHGRLDPTRTVEQAQAFARAIPGARLHLLDCGHSPVFERPAEVAAIVRGLVPGR
jgi:pimeloyl-ACP methyl ester carboxylesterase